MPSRCRYAGKIMQLGKNRASCSDEFIILEDNQEAKCKSRTQQQTKRLQLKKNGYSARGKEIMVHADRSATFEV